jgi:hypothetical protein
MFKNGVYLVLILFLGSVGFYSVHGLYNTNSVFEASLVFFVVSIAMTYLTTHFKQKVDLVPAQKVINFIYIALFALYGVVTGVALMYVPSVELTQVGYEGVVFLISSIILLYGLFVFSRKKLSHGV